MKRNLATILALVLIVCLLVPATAFAAADDTYKVTFTLSGPNAAEVTRTVSANYNYVPGNQTLKDTFANWAYDSLTWADDYEENSLAEIFAGTGLKTDLEGFVLAAKGSDDAAWQSAIDGKIDASKAAIIGNRSKQLCEIESISPLEFTYEGYTLTVAIAVDSQASVEPGGGGAPAPSGGGSGSGATGGSSTTEQSTTGTDGTVVKETTEADGTKSETVTVPASVTETTLPVTAEDGEVFNVDIPDGKTVDVTIPVDEGRHVVYQIMPDGSKKVLPIVAKTKDGLKLTLNDDVKIVIEEKKGTNGINQDEWYADAMNNLYDNEMNEGIPATELVPEVACDRGTFTTIMYNMCGAPATSGNSFGDVKNSDFFDDAVAWAKANNIVQGTSADTFEGNVDITREQIITILWRYVGKPAAAAVETGASDWAVEAMNWGVSVGLVQGDGTSYSPLKVCTVAEAAQLIKNFVDAGFGGVSNV